MSYVTGFPSGAVTSYGGAATSYGSRYVTSPSSVVTRSLPYSSSYSALRSSAVVGAYPVTRTVSPLRSRYIDPVVVSPRRLGTVSAISPRRYRSASPVIRSSADSLVVRGGDRYVPGYQRIGDTYYPTGSAPVLSGSVTRVLPGASRISAPYSSVVTSGYPIRSVSPSIVTRSAGELVTSTGGFTRIGNEYYRSNIGGAAIAGSPRRVIPAGSYYRGASLVSSPRRVVTSAAPVTVTSGYPVTSSYPITRGYPVSPLRGSYTRYAEPVVTRRLY